mmetsp:Transcript_82964/g.268422  ORF Transcript_82964/g.268422 Transcript_82964/m.268422 type:complete len:259 (-) Transcript_82964:7-783(-)
MPAGGIRGRGVEPRRQRTARGWPERGGQPSERPRSVVWQRVHNLGPQLASSSCGVASAQRGADPDFGAPATSTRARGLAGRACAGEGGEGAIAGAPVRPGPDRARAAPGALGLAACDRCALAAAQGLPGDTGLGRTRGAAAGTLGARCSGLADGSSTGALAARSRGIAPEAGPGPRWLARGGNKDRACQPVQPQQPWQHCGDGPRADAPHPVAAAAKGVLRPVSASVAEACAFLVYFATPWLARLTACRQTCKGHSRI